MNHQEQLVGIAADYLRQGLNVIPLPYAEKAARIRWKKYQQERVTEAQVHRWFGTREVNNIAIVLGDISGCVVRDFDRKDVYTAWASANPGLAQTAPTVRTVNGFHVYVRMDPIPRLRVGGVEAGELRGNGAYVCAPPSIHPTGARYEWHIPFKPDLPIVSFADLGLPGIPSQPLYRSKTEAHRSLQKADRSLQITEAINGRVVYNFDATIEVVRECIPTEVGQRERRLFELARRLIPLGPVELEQSLQVFDQWWELSKDIIGTKNYEISMNGFLRAVEKAEVPLQDVVAVCAQNAASKPRPEWSARFSAEAQLLAGICRELQILHGTEPFFISCRSAGKAIGTSHTFANTLLGLFERLKRLEVVARGTPGGKRATRFRYLGD